MQGRPEGPLAGRNHCWRGCNFCPGKLSGAVSWTSTRLKLCDNRCRPFCRAKSCLQQHVATSSYIGSKSKFSSWPVRFVRHIRVPITLEVWAGVAAVYRRTAQLLMLCGAWSARGFSPGGGLPPASTLYRRKRPTPALARVLGHRSQVLSAPPCCQAKNAAAAATPAASASRSAEQSGAA